MFAIGLILFFIAIAFLNYGLESALKARDWASVALSSLALVGCGAAWLVARYVQKKYFPEDD